MSQSMNNLYIFLPLYLFVALQKKIGRLKVDWGENKPVNLELYFLNEIPQ